jgi:subtilase family serine protease
MKHRIGGIPARRHLAALAVIAAVAMPASACGGGHSSSPADPPAAAADCLTWPASPCYTPQQLRAAYGIQPLLDRGITGRGQIIVLPEFPASTAGSPSATAGVPAVSDIRQDLTAFDSTFHLPAARLQVVNTLAHEASPWLASGEEVADTEIAHAVAPDAVIREVLIPSPDTASTSTVSAAVVAALRLGITLGGVISLSADAGEQCFTPAEATQFDSVLQTAQRDHVTVAVSSGDTGAATDPCPGAGALTPVRGVNLPASDPLALAVGGTSLQLNRSTGAYISETAWNTQNGPGSEASGGGFSQLFPRPAYQDGTAGTGTTRGVPDVAADADPDAGMALAISDGSHGYALTPAGGTSVSAPLWAGIIGLADQYAGRSLGFINAALYRIGGSASYHQAFHDVVSGTNTVSLSGQTVTGYQATAGWAPVTGWGSPDAQALVPLLARYASQ